MPRETVIVRTCDLCEPGNRFVVNSYLVAIGLEDDGQPVPYPVDVCETHETVVKQLAGAAQAPISAIPDRLLSAPTPADGSLSSWDCALCALTHPSRPALITHLQRAHGAPAPEYPKNRCPECGQRFRSAAGIGTHRYRAHGYDRLATLYEAATR